LISPCFLIIKESMEKKRCGWSEGTFEDYEKYHDEEWGVPVHDDRKHFEFLILEGAQAGLSWATILKRRDAYRRAFAEFNPTEVAGYSQAKMEELLLDVGIIRNRLKVQGAVNNAQKYLQVQNEFGSFDKYIWSFVDGKPIVNKRKNMGEITATSAESDSLSKDLKKRGFKFVGSTIMYAHMQACGLVNDHVVDCFRYHDVMS
jgi:DNA-3-methyladenine glycosylase I